MKTLYALQNKFEEHGSVMGTPRSGHPRTARTEENKMCVRLAITQNPQKLIED